MKQIDIEKILDEVRTDISNRNITDYSTEFDDMSYMTDGAEIPFDMDAYAADIKLMGERRYVNSYRDVSCRKKVIGPVVTFVRKVIRRIVCFYIEPLVYDQNMFNDVTTRTVEQTVRRYEDADARIDYLEKELYRCERLIHSLEEYIKKSEEIK